MEDEVAPLTRCLWARGGRDAEAAASTLRKIVDNIIERPGELKLRRVREAGATFSSNVLTVPGAMAVLEKCGFERVNYPDGPYWTLRVVNVRLLMEVRLELDAGIAAMRRLHSKRAVHSDEAEPVDSSTAQVPQPQLTLPSRSGAHRVNRSEIRVSESASAENTAQSVQLRQLQARAVVHRIKAREELAHKQQWWQRRRLCWTSCAAVTLFVIVGTAWISPLAGGAFRFGV